MAKLTDEQKKIIRMIEREAIAAGIDPDFAIAIANLESNFQHIPAQVPQGQPASTAFGPFQVNKATAQANGVDYEEMKKDPELAVRTGIANLVRHAKNPVLQNDPLRIAAAHRLGENSEFAKTGDLNTVPRVLATYLADAAEHFSGQTFPESIYSGQGQPAAQASEGQQSGEGDPGLGMGTTPLANPTISQESQTNKMDAAEMAGLGSAVVGAVKQPAFALAKNVYDVIRNRGAGALTQKDINDAVEARMRALRAAPPPATPTATPTAATSPRKPPGGENWQRSLTGISTPGAQMDKSSLDLAKRMQGTVGIGGTPGFVGGTITDAGIILNPRDAAAVQRRPALELFSANRQTSVNERLNEILARNAEQQYQKNLQQAMGREPSKIRQAVTQTAKTVSNSPLVQYGSSVGRFGLGGFGAGYNLANADEQFATGTPLGYGSAAASTAGALGSLLSIHPKLMAKAIPATAVATATGDALADINRGDYESAKGKAYLGFLGLSLPTALGALFPSTLNKSEKEWLERRRNMPPTISP